LETVTRYDPEKVVPGGAGNSTVQPVSVWSPFDLALLVMGRPGWVRDDPSSLMEVRVQEGKLSAMVTVPFAVTFVSVIVRGGLKATTRSEAKRPVRRKFGARFYNRFRGQADFRE
jgi:hypothetical protein